jgi:hypothetical protein
LIGAGEIKAETLAGIGGKRGARYKIPLPALPARLQVKHRKALRREALAGLAGGGTSAGDPAALSDGGRRGIAGWKKALGGWRLFRFKSGLSKREADELFIGRHNALYPGAAITRPTLFRKWQEYREGGDMALFDGRGEHGNHKRKITPRIWGAFEPGYLDDKQPSVALCLAMTKRIFTRWLETGEISEMPDFPTLGALERAVKKIPYPAVAYFRYGEMKYISGCGPYIKRIYGFAANDYWVCDNQGMYGMTPDGAFAALLTEKRVVPEHLADEMLSGTQNPLRYARTAFPSRFTGGSPLISTRVYGLITRAATSTCSSGTALATWRASGYTTPTGGSYAPLGC